MKMTSHHRADRPANTGPHHAQTKLDLARTPRKTQTRRAPQRLWQSRQMQQGASMAYQLGFTSGPLS